MNMKWTLRAFQFFGVLMVFIGVSTATVFITNGSPIQALFAYMIAFGGMYVDRYGTTRLVYTEPLDLVMKKARLLKQEEELLTRKVDFSRKVGR